MLRRVYLNRFIDIYGKLSSKGFTVEIWFECSKQVLHVKGFIDKDGFKYLPIVARKGTLIP